jgi:hypothetical protein
MHPVRRGLRPLTITALAAGLLVAGPATVLTAPAAAGPKKAKQAKKKAQPVRCHAGGQAARPGDTLVVITTVRDADSRKVVERRSEAFTCSTTGAWDEITSPTAGVTLIPTSIVVERTETTR